MKYFKLIEGITTPQKVNIARTVKGKITYCPLRLVPGEKYELEDDKLLIDSLKKLVINKKYTTELEVALKKAGVPYEIKQCKSCGGMKRTIVYPIVEVIENETESD